MLRRAPPNNPQLLWGGSLEFSDREESGKSNLCFPDSCEDARQQVGAGSACRQQQVAVGTAGRQHVGAGSACPGGLICEGVRGMI